MNNRFTGKAQNALNNSLRFARAMGHTYIGSEHLLLSLTAENESVAAKLLFKHGVTTDKVRERIAEAVGLGSESAVTPADMTPRTKKIIEGSAIEAARTGQNYIGTEHLLLALLAERDCVAVKIIGDLSADAEDIASEVKTLLGSTPTAKSGRAEGRAEGGLAGAPTLSSFGRENVETFSLFVHDVCELSNAPFVEIDHCAE